MRIDGIDLSDFDEVVVVDSEFFVPPGERPNIVAVTVHELNSGKTHSLFADDLTGMREAPYPLGPRALFITFFGSAEIGTHLALGWSLPTHMIDLYIENKNGTNGLSEMKYGLLDALVHHGLGGMAKDEKVSMRQLVMRGGPYTAQERAAILEYCEQDVVATKELFLRMLPTLDIPRAILRGRFMIAAARIERCGVPIDTVALAILRKYWAKITKKLIRRLDAKYGLYDGTTFKRDRFVRWNGLHDISWPFSELGIPLLDSDTFDEHVLIYPELAPIQQLRQILSEMRTEDIAVGSDGRNRTLVSPFSARTGRNQPSVSASIFGRSACWRHLIRPAMHRSLAYIDWSQQEFAIAAVLSGDTNMIRSYETGDIYINFAILCGLAPVGATKESHPEIRERCKQCILGTQYSMGSEMLGRRIGQTPAHARELLNFHRKTYARFWAFSDATLAYAMLYNRLQTVFGWTIHVPPNPNPRSLRNFPMQSNGAEMLRLACCFATEAGVNVCAPVHDALLVEASTDEIDHAAEVTRAAMARASRAVLDGFEIRTDVKLVHYPDRYRDPRGAEMWKAIWDTIAEIDPLMKVIAEASK